MSIIAVGSMSTEIEGINGSSPSALFRLCTCIPCATRTMDHSKLVFLETGVDHTNDWRWRSSDLKFDCISSTSAKSRVQLSPGGHAWWPSKARTDHCPVLMKTLMKAQQSKAPSEKRCDIDADIRQSIAFVRHVTQGSWN
jgi:hypothetical protein